jgi:ABC-type transport system involved in multi-copper enzyme maturation permease subunit
MTLSTAINIFMSVIFWILMTIGVGMICLFILIVWQLVSSEPDDKLVLQNYEELDALIADENVRTDGKSPPLYEGLTTSNYWYHDYAGNIPPELIKEHSLVAVNRDGFKDTSSIALFALNTGSANALSERLVTNIDIRLDYKLLPKS